MKKPPETLTELAEAVAEMRRLGVQEWGDIKLGPEPHVPIETKKPTPDELHDRREERRRDILFAASPLKPVLPKRDK